MDVRRRLFVVWILLAATWLVGCIWFGAARWHWFEATRIYEVADGNDEKYRVEVDPDSTDDEILDWVKDESAPCPRSTHPPCREAGQPDPHAGSK